MVKTYEYKLKNPPLNLKFELFEIENEKKCHCKPKQSKIKQNESAGRPFKYPDEKNGTFGIFKTFEIKCNYKLSLVTKFLLNTFQNKYLYYAIDDILCLLKFNSIEKNNLLEILYSPIIFLQNNFSIDFSEIWIHQIYINETSKKNRFLKDDTKSYSYITIELFYTLPLPSKKQETLW